MENKDVRIGLVIMASGLGKRFGGGKLMALLQDKPLVQWIIQSTEGVFDKRVVVTRSKDIMDLCYSLNVDCIYHDLPGRNDTVRIGLSAIMDEVDYCFFAPGDQPLIKRETFLKLIAKAKAFSDKIIRTGYEDVVGTPTGFPKWAFEELLNLPDKKGGSWVVNNHSSMVEMVMTREDYELWDVDTVSDLEKINLILDSENK